MMDLSPLQDSELFRALTPEELSKIGLLCTDFVVIEGGAVFTEGREASHLYLVARGKIGLQKSIRAPHGRRSRRTTITVCGPGEALGWSALVEPHKYTLSAVAWESSKLVRIDSKMLRRALDKSPEIESKVIRSLSVVMSRRFRQITSTLISEREAAFAGSKDVAPDEDLRRYQPEGPVSPAVLSTMEPV